ncbi:MAG: protein arginine kinase [Clostridia bacterium]|nr:protein arginine kinase [Clostridia bacterium]
MIWYKEKNPDIVISTRVRLARNLDKIPFPGALDNPDEVIKKIKDAVFNSNSTLSADFEDMKLSMLSKEEKIRLSESHLISSQMLSSGSHECLINKDRTMSLMIMEEDHLREQVILGGYKLDDAFEICDKVDDVLSENLDFAFDEQTGYLTACPTNVGTGLRASVMMHLPALTLSGSMNRIIASASNVGITVRGYYGEGSEAEGFFYQISNQITTGATEREIIDRVKNVSDQIIAFEKEARASLLKNNKTAVEDRVYRSYGILKYARSISSKEAISLISDVLFGKNMGIIKEESKISPMEMIVCSGPAHITDGSATPDVRDIKRSEYIRGNV